MIILLFGKDQFRLEQKLAQIKKDFVKKTGTDFNIFVFEKGTDFEKIKSRAETESFLSQEKFLILKNFLSQKNKREQEQILDWLKNLSKNIWVVFIETEKELSENSTLVYKIKKIGEVFRFDLLPYPQLINWVLKQCLEKKGKITPQAAKTLVFFVGQNLHQTENELEKLINFKQGELIQVEDVELLTKPQVSPNIFKLIDSIGEKNWQKSYKILDQMLELGENPLYIHTMIVYQFRNLILIRYLLNQKLSKNQIILKTKLHPFVVQKTIAQSASFDFQKLKKIYSKLLEADLALKRKDKDPVLILDLLVVALTK